ncbi:DUF3710 domain-containing protein [Demequina sp. B12]|uniref:DUF3710 domain-containing protein n=1 Tax=Demequina sp. B12 TaxID=2992757 RepID=UPI00237A1750|nr:DUF3710 domain-containing protein [Demequina sp. B12]MDE0572991.1 DUF3710 domain-containing protein [Demequina sp. B12]
MSEAVAYDDGLDALESADGPWSWDHVPEGKDFIYYGPLRLPAVAHMRVRAEIDPKTRKCGAVSVKVADCQVQLQVIAAPRGTGQWTEVRRAITARLRSTGRIEAEEGRFGPELAAHITRQNKKGETVVIPMRFQGIDGDRWLLKAAAMGPSVHSADTRARIDAFLSNCAVERGPEAMIAGTILVLDTPKFTSEESAPDAESEAPATEED